MACSRLFPLNSLSVEPQVCATRAASVVTLSPDVYTMARVRR